MLLRAGWVSSPLPSRLDFLPYKGPRRALRRSKMGTCLPDQQAVAGWAGRLTSAGPKGLP